MLEVFLILLCSALSCSLLGNILVLKKEAMIADALSHSVLLGIVIGFAISHSLESPLLFIGATVFGVLCVFFIDFIMNTSQVNHDTATGLVFPLLFSIAVILISTFFSNVHLDIDMVLMGEVIFAPLNRVTFLGFDIPFDYIKNGINVLINVSFLFIAFHYLKAYLFDTTYARLSRHPMTLLKVVTLTLVSLTTVLSFDTVGSITVICFFVAGPMSVLFWVKSFKQMLIFSSIVTTFNCFIGVTLAYALDLTISGTTSFISLMIFIVSVLLKLLFTRLKRLHTVS